MRSKRIWAVAAVLLCSGLVLAALTPAPGVSVEKKAAQVVPQSAISARAVDQVVGKPSEVAQVAAPSVSAAQPPDDPALLKQEAELEIMAEPIVAGERAYCAAGANVFDEYIQNVTVGTINNTSSWSTGGYADYTYLSTDMVIGQAYTITVTIGTPYSSDRGGLWVDWNNDEDFDDPGEQLYSGQPWTGYGPYVGTISPPPGTPVGAKRMRVRLAYASNPLPCGTTTYGEVEDYTINVLAPAPEGACCFNDVCQGPLSETDCLNAGGVYMGDGSACAPNNPCVGACCYPDGSCVVLAPASCTGNYLGGGTNCGPPNPCPQPPDFVVTGPYPYSNTSDTCGANSDCALRPSEEETYEVHIPNAGLWTFSLCGGATWDTYMYLGTTLCGSEIAFNDDSCGLQSQITASLTPGVYYVTIEAYGSTTCGPYTFQIIPPCELECPPEGFVEGEPLCGQDYVDTWNGGCNSTPPVFQTIGVPVTICGESGTYLFGTDQYRDTDWFEYVATGMNQYTFTVTAEFPVRIFVLNGTAGCAGLTQIATANGPACAPVTIQTVCLSPGTYWFWVGPDAFTGIDCGSEYIATLTAEPCVVMGACCRGAVCTVETMDDCVSGGGIYRGDNVPCDPNPCAVADEVITGPYPYAASGNTCGAQNNCLLRDSEDYIYEVHIPSSGLWTFSLCGGATWDTLLYLGTIPCSGDIAYNDDACGLQSEIVTSLTPGVYYVTVEAYSTTVCGEYTLYIIPPCELECPPNGYPEDEPLCGQDYVDTYNGGCNSSPYVFQPIGCHSTICGKSGTYLFGTDEYRDTDWFEYVATETMTYTWTVTAEFPVRIFVLDGTNGCGGLTQIATANGPACVPVTITTGILPPGTYWFWVGPNVFTGIACDADYVASLTCTQVIGACCSLTGCEVLTEADCNATGGLWMGPNTECDVNDCNNNGIVDECELALFPERDCNHNGVPDDCDIASGTSQDCQPDGIPDECQLNTTLRGNLLADPSFEAGTPNGFWTEYSLNFGTPLCDAASCGTGGGTAGPHSGSWWAWFGGYSGYETAYLEQSVTIPSAAQAFLRFYLWKGTGTQATDYVNVKLDNNVVFTVYGDSTAYPSYTLVELNVSSYADGGTHTVRFESETFGGTTTNFSIDDVELVTAGPPANDCNGNGVPDECDIQEAFGGYCHEPTYPPCDTDYNHNGVPDHCELCGDLNGDGFVDALDYWIMLDGFGRCAPDPRYIAASAMDVNGNNCIDLVDYQAWFLCYKMANGKAFVPPPQTRPRTSLTPQAAPKPALH